VRDQLSSASNSLKEFWARRLPRASTLTAVLAISAIVILKLLSQGDPSKNGSEVWIPRLEIQNWPPLQHLVSAALLAAGAFITLRAVRRSAVTWVALILTLLSVWLLPARASVAGFTLCALMTWACHRYVDRPSTRGFWLLAVITMAIGALRADFGLYATAAAIAALFAAHIQDGVRAFRSAALGYIGALAVMLLAIAPLGKLPSSLYNLGHQIIAVVSRGSFVVERTFNVRWASGVDAAEREAKERDYALVGGLENREDPGGRTWRYQWTRPPRASILRLLNDPAVEDTQGIDRSSAQYIGTNGLPYDDREWIRTLPTRAPRSALAVVAAARWLWVVLPLLAIVRLRQVASRRDPVRPASSETFIILPALILCLPIARLVVQDPVDWGPLAAAAMPALAVVAAWLVSGPLLRRRAVVETSGWQRLDARDSGAAVSPPPYDTYICLGLVALTVFLHLSVNTDVTNDHTAYLSMARQIVHGDWPIRDFRDDGALLQILLSAGVQKVGGYQLLGEMLLSWTFFAIANCLTYWLAFRLSRNRVAAATAAMLAAVLIPRPYAYPKIFIYPLAILMLWRYAERPRLGRLVAVAATVALAFLFRIDHGVVIAMGSVLAVAAVHLHEPRLAVKQSLLLTVTTLAFGLPQLAYVTWSVGLPRYIESVGSFGGYAIGNSEPWPLMLSLADGLLTETNATAVILDLYIFVAAITLVIAGAQLFRAWSRRTAAPQESLWILAVLLVWALALPMLARGEHYTRVAEIGQPIAILGAWLATRWLQHDAKSPARWTVVGALLVATLVALSCRVPAVAFFTRSARVFEKAPFQPQFLKQLAMSPPIDHFAPADSPRTYERLVRYAYACTKPDDRLLVTWFAPEMYFYADRKFAGDRWIYMPFDNSPERQQRIIDGLRRQSVPVIFVDADGYTGFRQSWPALAAYLEQSYRLEAEVPIDEEHVIRVLAFNGRVPSRYVEFKDLPCFD